MYIPTLNTLPTPPPSPPASSARVLPLRMHALPALHGKHSIMQCRDGGAKLCLLQEGREEGGKGGRKEGMLRKKGRLRRLGRKEGRRM